MDIATVNARSQVLLPVIERDHVLLPVIERAQIFIFIERAQVLRG